MFDPIISSLNRYLASEEAYDAAMEATEELRAELEEVQAQMKRYFEMDYADVTDAMLDHLVILDQQQHKLVAEINRIMSPVNNDF